ncbi:MAG: GNAT family N-acetyltransferase [Ilumatobacteraceae bacterium]|nr:GNAT family N-acetyltransferase [Ilumatobacteraceae bacterium]
MQAYFRDAVGTDLPALGALLRGSSGADSGPDGSTNGSYRDALAEIDRTDGNYLLVAEYDRQIVAVLQLVAYRQLHERGGRTAQIVLLRVAEEYRTSGVTGMLVDHAVGRARDLGCRRVQVMSGTDRSDEHPFWERAGFVQLDRGYARPLD